MVETFLLFFCALLTVKLLKVLLKAYTIRKICKHSELSEEKVKYITEMVSKDEND